MDDEDAFEITSRWKEEVFYWEGARGLLLDSGWGVTPWVTYVPSEAIWADVVPEWAQGRRDVIVDRLAAWPHHRIVETDHYAGSLGVTR